MDKSKIKDEDFADMKLEAETEKLLNTIHNKLDTTYMNTACTLCTTTSKTVNDIAKMLPALRKSIRKAQYVYYGKGFINGRDDGYNIGKEDGQEEAKRELKAYRRGYNDGLYDCEY